MAIDQNIEPPCLPSQVFGNKYCCYLRGRGYLRFLHFVRAAFAESREMSFFRRCINHWDSKGPPLLTYFVSFKPLESFSADMVTTRSHRRPRQTSRNSARSVILPEEDEAPKDTHVVFNVRKDHACHTEKSMAPEPTSQVLLASQHSHQARFAHCVHYRAVLVSHKPSQNISSRTCNPDNIPKPSAPPRYPALFPSLASHRWA